MKKHLQKLAFTSLVLVASQGRAQVSQELQINTKILPGKSAYSSKIVSVIDETGLTSEDAAGTAKVVDPLKSKFEKILAGYGAVTIGPETGLGRSSLQVEHLLLNPNENLAKGSLLQSNLNEILTAMKPVRSDFQDIFFSNGIPYIELLNASSEDLSTFLHCVLFDYQENVAGKVKFPVFAKPASSPKCSSKTSVAELTAATRVADASVQRLKPQNWNEWFASQRQYFSPVLLEVDVMQCLGPSMTATKSAEIVVAGWASPNDDYTKRVKACLLKGIDLFYGLEELLNQGFQPSVLNKNITPYYRSLVLSMLESKADAINNYSKNLSTNLKKDITSAVSFKEGFSKNPVDMSDFNLADFNKAATDRTKTPDELLAILFGAPKGKISAFREELSNTDQASREEFADKLKRFISQSCDFQAFKVSCLRDGLSKLSSNQAKVMLTFGLENELIWEGYHFFTSNEAVVE